MKTVLKRIVKFFLKIFWIFPINNNKIYFKCFSGETYGFDAKAILEYLNIHCEEKFFYVWEYEGVCKISDIAIPVKAVKKNTISQIIELMTAKFVIVNINPAFYIPYRHNQVIINTWHGFGIKAAGQLPSKEEQFNLSKYFCSPACMFSNKIIEKSFMYHGIILECGSPRNDILFDKKHCDLNRKKVRKLFDVGDNVKIVLYAPTFRDDFIYKDMSVDYERLCHSLSSSMGGEWIVFERLHPMIKKKVYCSKSNITNVTDYPDIQDLLCAADVLISDYSGCMWDFSQTGNPVFVFAPDIKEYKASRGIYIDLNKLPYPIATSNHELMHRITSFDMRNYEQKRIDFYKYVGSYEKGDACEKISSCIMKELR